MTRADDQFAADTRVALVESSVYARAQGITPEEDRYDLADTEREERWDEAKQ